jgi:hypothetical protein
MSCEGCFTTQKELNRSLQIAKEKAKKYAIENEKTVVIYQTLEGFDFMEEEHARANDIPCNIILSHLQFTSNG